MRYFIIFLMFCFTIYAADHWVVGGNGTRANANALNGGGFDDGTANWDDMQGANGGPTADTANTVTGSDDALGVVNNGGNVQLQGADSGAWFASVTVGTYVNCEFAATYQNGRYAVLSIDNSNDDITINLSYSADTTADAWVGGAFANPFDIPQSQTGTEEFLDASDHVWIQGSASYTSQHGANDCIWLITASGGSITPFIIEGHIADVTDAEIGDGGIAKLDAADTYNDAARITGAFIVIKNIQFTQGTDDGLDGDNTADDVTCINCSFDNNGDDGCSTDNSWAFQNCFFSTNVNQNLYANGLHVMVSNSVFHTAANGVYSIGGVFVTDSLFYNHSAEAIWSNNAGTATNDYNIVTGCTFDGENGGSSIGYFNTFATISMGCIQNCIFYDLNIGIDTDGAGLELMLDRNNVFYSCNDNVSDWPEPSADATPNLRGSYTAAADPFTDASTRDYSLTAAIQGTGVDAKHTQAFWADYNGGAGDNPPNPLTGLSKRDPGGEESTASGGGGGQPVIGGSVVR